VIFSALDDAVPQFDDAARADRLPSEREFHAGSQQNEGQGRDDRHDVATPHALVCRRFMLCTIKDFAIDSVVSAEHHWIALGPRLQPCPVTGANRERPQAARPTRRGPEPHLRATYCQYGETRSRAAAEILCVK
jgi:hypothetical protein